MPRLLTWAETGGSPPARRNLQVFVWTFVCLAGWLWAPTAQAQGDLQNRSASLAPASAFAQQAQIWNVLLSPSGRSLVSIQAGAKAAQLVVGPTKASPIEGPVRIDPPFGTFRWARWLTEDRLIASVELTLEIGSYTEQFRRYIAVDPDGSNLKLLGRSRLDLRRPGQGGDALVSFLSQDDDHVLIAAKRGLNATRASVYKANIWTGKTQKVQPGRRNITSWLADRSGNIRLGFGYKDTESLIYERRPGQTSWDLSFRFDVYKDPSFIPLAFAKDGGLFVLSNHASDRKTLYKFNLETKQFGPPIYAHPRYDLSGVILGSEERELLGASVSGSQTENIYFDEERLTFDRQLEQLIGTDRFQLSSVDETGRLATVIVAGSNDPGRHLLVDLDAKQVTLLGHIVPRLAGLAMPEMRKIEYRARDGLPIEGYITKPDGTNGPLPLIVMPHGGPGIRETDVFNPFTQFLVNRGYAVLQMNFRGSTGFGRRHLQSGYRQWGLNIQNDIEDGTRWAIAQGHADPDRICLFGGSFGGYAALMGVIKSPDLYQCAASLNGVSDITLMLRNRQRLSTKAILPITIGDMYRERDGLKARSPLYNVSKIEVPVLLAHGLKDNVVSPKHSKRLASKLAQAGLPHTALYYKGGTHDLSAPALRTQFFQDLEVFLRTNLEYL